MSYQNNVAVDSKAIISNIIRSCEDRFDQFENSDYKTEALFATQMCQRNNTLANAAIKNPTSMQLALLNLAAVGLSLNPSQGHAYLVPRDGQVILDISYRGLIALAIECGSIQWARPVLVYEADKFEFHGPMREPTHDCDPFLPIEHRGAVRGGYVITKLAIGELMVGTMDYATMEKIRLSSPSGSHPKGPWVNWKDQMQLKVMIKRESKFWPQSSTRMAEAVRILNEDNGEGLSELNRNHLSVIDGSVSSLPAPAPREKVKLETIDLVDNLLSRAMSDGCFEACREIAKSRISDSSELSFAYGELDKCKELYVERQQQLDVLASVN